MTTRTEPAQWTAVEVHSQLRARHLQKFLEDLWNAVAVEMFRRLLGTDFYRRWKMQLGPTAWGLLEKETGGCLGCGGSALKMDSGSSPE